ncbi:MAG: hypothetical protein ACOX8T_11080 [Bacillota bacterium]|jgi:hypothetical protein
MIEDRGYWERRDAEIAATAQADVAYSQSEAGRLEELQRKLNALDARDDAGRAAVFAEIQAIESAREERFTTEWTREVTIARRAEWNALVKSGKLGRGKKVDYAAKRAAEKAQGWTLDGLKRAIKLHGL